MIIYQHYGIRLLEEFQSFRAYFQDAVILNIFKKKTFNQGLTDYRIPEFFILLCAGTKNAEFIMFTRFYGGGIFPENDIDDMFLLELLFYGNDCFQADLNILFSFE